MDTYNTLTDLLNAKILFATGYQDYYYVKPQPKSTFDEAVWKINKSTGEMQVIHLVDYFQVRDNATPVSISTLKKKFKV